MNKDNSKRSLKAEEISINARSVYIDGTEMKEQANKLNGKAKSDALKMAFNKHLEAIHMQELAFGIYMNDPDIIYDESKDEVKDLTAEKNKNNQSDNDRNDVTVDSDNENNNNQDIYNSDKDPNIYESKEDFIVEKTNMSNEDISALNDAKDKKQYADNIMKEVDSDYAKIEKIRNEADNTDDEYEKNMKSKMAEGMENVLTDKMIKAADLYFNANKTKYDIYKKYLPAVRTSEKINEAKKYEESAEELHANALMKYHKSNFYSGHKSNKYIQLMDAVQTELSAIQQQENAFSIYLNKPEATVDIPEIKKGKTNDNENKGETLTYNLEGRYMYSKSNPKPVPLKNKPGIVFKVQVGLFKTMLPLSRYGKYSPISYDTFKNNPYKRFYLGEYRSYRAAEYVLNKIKRKGLSDPFIIAFEDGIKKSKTYGISKIVRNENFEKQEAREMSLLIGKPWYGNENNNDNNTVISENDYSNENISGNSEIKNVSEFNGLIYCVQIGNFSSTKQKTDFPNITNLLTENNKATYKYMAGPYSSYAAAKQAANKLKDSGYKGAFVTAYNYGEKISLQQAKEIAGSGTDTDNISNSNTNNIYFSVQIAAYSHKLNNAEMQEFAELSKKYKINVTQIDNGLFLYTVGKYKTYKEAAEIKKEIKALHKDGFVIAFKNGIKISASEAIELLKN